jgi:hypothetical protein
MQNHLTKVLVGVLVIASAAIAGPRQKAESPRRDIQFRLGPWVEESFSPFLEIGHFFVVVDNETSFSVPAARDGLLQEYVAVIADHYLLHDATNTFSYRPVTVTGKVGDTDVVDVYLIPPTPTPVPDPDPPGFRVLAVEPAGK